MAFEVVEGNHEVVVGHVAAHDVVLDVGGVLHGDAHLALLVHNVDAEQGCEAVTLDDLPVVGRGVALVLLVAGAAAVGGVALHDGAVHQLHEVLDELGLQVVGVAALAGGDFHSYAALGLHAEGLVDIDQPLGRDVAGEVDDGLAVSLRGSGRLLFL